MIITRVPEILNDNHNELSWRQLLDDNPIAANLGW